MESTKKTARFAGLLYLMLALTGAYGIIYVPSQIIVLGDASSTAKNLLSNEFIFRTGMVSDLIGNTIFVFLVLVLYRLFKDVNMNMAKLMVALVLVQIPVVFITEAFNISALMLFKGEILKTFGLIQRQDLGMLFLNINNYGTITLELFWGLWLLPFGILVYNSNFIPRLFGYLLIIGGGAYIIESLTHILFPGKSTLVSQFTIVFYTIGELSIVFWLLIKGTKTQPAS